jgi:hypothetical protein
MGDDIKGKILLPNDVTVFGNVIEVRDEIS